MPRHIYKRIKKKCISIIVTLFAAISSAISSRPCKLLVIPRRFESPVVYAATIALAEIAAKITSINGPLHGIRYAY